MTEVYHKEEHEPSSTPAANPAFFEAPITTILASYDPVYAHTISSHHLMDAYHTLLFRLKIAAPSLSAHGPAHPPLQAWASNSTTLARCIQRDIRRSIEDSIVLASQQPSNRDACSSELHPGMLRAARDATTLSQLAVRVVTMVFKFPVLQAQFLGKCFQPLEACMRVLIIFQS